MGAMVQMGFFRGLPIQLLYKYRYLVGGDWNMNFMTFHILGMSSSNFIFRYILVIIIPTDELHHCSEG